MDYVTRQTGHADKASSRRHRTADGLKGKATSHTAPARGRNRKRRRWPPTWCGDSWRNQSGNAS